MRSRWLIIILLVLGGQYSFVYGQSSDPAPGLRNITSFVTGDSNFYWVARVGQRIYNSANHNDTTTGNHIMSSCTTAPDIPDSNILKGVYDYYISSYNNLPGATYNWECEHPSWDTGFFRFAIIDSTHAGIDTLTIFDSAAMVNGIGLQRIAPGYRTSVRLGCMRSGSGVSYARNLNTEGVPADSLGLSPYKQTDYSSQALFYTMTVNEQNALLLINYAIVARRYDHDAYDAGEFFIRVVNKENDSTWSNEPIDDNLWYKVSVPHMTGTLAELYPWMPGLNYDWPCNYCYKPWTKVAINLMDYIGEQVRIEFYTSNCIFDADPLYAYFCGDYQAAAFTSSGCPEPSSPVVDTLYAPGELSGYVWYVAMNGPVDYENLNNSEYMDNVQWSRLYPSIGAPPSTNNWYGVKPTDFIIRGGPNAGDTSAIQTFMCRMTSALDPAKPFDSRIYTNLINNKPYIHHLDSSDCNTLEGWFTNTSVVKGDVEVDTSATYWVVYKDSLWQEPADTLYGESIYYQFPRRGHFAVRLFVFTLGEDCGSVGDFIFTLDGPPAAQIGLSDTTICEGESIDVNCVVGCNYTKQWQLDGDDVNYNQPDFTFTPELGRHNLHLTLVDDNGCFSETDTGFMVYGIPRLEVDPMGGYICPGDTAHITAIGTDEYVWTSYPVDTTLDSMQGQQTIGVSPNQTTTYKLKASQTNPCAIVDVGTTISPVPYPILGIKTSRDMVSTDKPAVVFDDVSQNRHHTHWLFSDGATDEGVHVVHRFDGLLGDSVGITMTSCNRIDCCADTSISLPVVVNNIWFPNVFTPDNDINNRFGIVTSCAFADYEIFIYNRQGQLVHHSTDATILWNGSNLDGRPCPQGAYTYSYRYSLTKTGNHYSGAGTVTLLR